MEQQCSSDRVCWLCLCGSEPGGDPLTLPCKCRQMFSHPKCMGRWQLQQAGREEEQRCRFCKGALPSWTRTLLDTPPQAPANSTAGLPSPTQFYPAMMVMCNGRTVKLPCVASREGAEEFKAKVQNIFNLDASQPLDVVFQLQLHTSALEPGQRVSISGFQAFQAAATVANICAAKSLLQPLSPTGDPPSEYNWGPDQQQPTPSPRSQPPSDLASPVHSPLEADLSPDSARRMNQPAWGSGTSTPRRQSALSSTPSSPRCSSPRGWRVVPVDEPQSDLPHSSRFSPTSSFASSLSRASDVTLASSHASSGGDAPKAAPRLPRLARLLIKASSFARSPFRHLFFHAAATTARARAN